MFTAPEGAPHCEVYSFSVTATYVSATYTGTSRSVRSPVLGMQDATFLPRKSSLNYFLEKQRNGLNNAYSKQTVHMHTEIQY